MIGTDKVEEFNKLLRDKNLTIVCAESITAGLLASTIASLPGASSILKGSIVTYSRELKTEILKVDPEIIDRFTAESTQTTVEMVKGLVKIFPNADIHIAVTGIASPGTTDYPIKGEVGDVFIALNHKMNNTTQSTVVYTIKIEETERNKIREKAVMVIFERITELISKTTH